MLFLISCNEIYFKKKKNGAVSVLKDFISGIFLPTMLYLNVVCKGTASILQCIYLQLNIVYTCSEWSNKKL